MKSANRFNWSLAKGQFFLVNVIINKFQCTPSCRLLCQTIRYEMNNIQKYTFTYYMASTSCWISWLSCVWRSLSFFFSTDSAEKTIVSGLRDPHDSTLKKYLFGFPKGSYGASSAVELCRQTSIYHMIFPFIKPFHKFSNKTHVT